MAIIAGQEVFTLLDHAKRMDPDGKIATIAELRNQTNEVLDDLILIESNKTTSHLVTVRTDLPKPTWRKLNYGVKPTKSKTKQVEDTMGMMEDRTEMDRDVAKLNGNDKGVMLSEDRATIEGMNQDMASTLFYGDTDINPEQFMGLAARYPHKDTPNVIDAGGTGDDLSSVWLICWGPETAFCIFPKGSKAGLDYEDLGVIDLEDSDGGKYRGYASWHQWKMGLCIKDWRYVVRIANIETTGATNTISEEHLIEAVNLVPNLNMGKPVIYMNKTIQTQLMKVANAKTNASFTMPGDGEGPFGRRVTKFWGIPIRRVDALLKTESALVAA